MSPVEHHFSMLAAQSDHKGSAATATTTTSTDMADVVATPDPNTQPNYTAVAAATEFNSDKAAASSSGNKGTKNGTKQQQQQPHRKRARATTEQVTVLESVFLVNRSPASRLREDLASRLGMAPRQVQVWFQNRRAKEKTQQRNPRNMQNNQSMTYDPLAYGNINPELYSMALAPGFLPMTVDPIHSAGTTGTFGLNAANPAMAQQPSQQQPLLDNQFALAAAAAAAAANGVVTPGATTTNPWADWSLEMARQGSIPASSAQLLAMHSGDPQQMMLQAGPTTPSATYNNSSTSISDGSAIMDANNCNDDAASAPAVTKTATAAANITTPVHGANIADSRRESEMSGITAVASPVGNGPVAGISTVNGAEDISTSALSISPTTMVVPAPNASVLPEQPSSTAVTTHISNSGGGGTARRPAPLPLVGIPGGGMAIAPPGFNNINNNPMAISGRVGMGYIPFIPEVPSYMALDIARLTVGSWHRVPMADTELTCLACVEPPVPKPVQRPGNHRPTELDSLVGEFQWIISSGGVRYKMVVPYSAVSRIRFREVPDSAKDLVDSASESVVNPQAALSLLHRTMKNPHSNAELAIHVYDLPTYYFQVETGEWREIGDFSENHSASGTYVHTLTGSFVSLFNQMRILLATCSRLKIAADPLMALWLGSMDDPYSAIASIPHDAWIPCGGFINLHSTNHSGNSANGNKADTNNQPAQVLSGNSCASGLMPTSAGASSFGTLTPTPTTAAMYPPPPLQQQHIAPPALGSARQSVLAFQDIAQNIDMPLKTQRSASLPFIRSAAGHNKPATSSRLCRAVDGAGSPINEDSPSPEDHPDAATADSNIGMAAVSSSASHPNALQISSSSSSLRHRTSCHHLRRPAPYQVAPPSGSPRSIHSPQTSTAPPFWAGHNILRRESDTELALAFNSAFANGDVFGAHRRFSELHAVPPSPLANLALATSSIQADPESFSSSSVQTSSATAVSGAADGNCQAMANNNISSSMDIPGSTEMMMALFGAMNGNINLTSPPSATTLAPGSMDISGGAHSMFVPASFSAMDPASFMLNGTSVPKPMSSSAGTNPANMNAMDWCFDWSQAAACCAVQAATATSEDMLVAPTSMAVDNNNNMSVDWSLGGGDNEKTAAISDVAGSTKSSSSTFATGTGATTSEPAISATAVQN